MQADEITRARRKLTALRRAERRLRHRFEDIDYELDVLSPELEELKAKAEAGGDLPTFEIESK